MVLSVHHATCTCMCLYTSHYHTPTSAHVRFPSKEEGEEYICGLTLPIHMITIHECMSALIHTHTHTNLSVCSASGSVSENQYLFAITFFAGSKYRAAI